MSLNRLPVQSWLAAGLLTGLFALSGHVVPGLLPILSLIWAVPIVFVVKRHGLYPGVLAVLLAGIIVGISAGPLVGVLAILEIGSLALVMGLLYKNAVPAQRIILIGTVVIMLLQLPIVMANYALFDVENPQVKQEMEQQRTEVMKFIKQQGLVGSTEGVSDLELSQVFEQSWRLSRQLIPGATIIFAFLTALTNYKFAYYYFTLRKELLPPDLPLSLWRFPWYTIWGLIVGLSLLLIGQGAGIIDLLGKNVVLVSLFFNFILGIGIFSYYLSRTSLPRLLKIILVVLMLSYFPIAVMLLAFIGTFDPVVNFRRL